MKDVLGFEKEYSAFDDGKIFSKIKGRFLKLKSFDGWYINLRLCKDGIQYPTKAHRVIATTFLSNPNNLKDVNHKNGIKSDNRVENLEWCSRSQNQKHAYRELFRIPVSGSLNGRSKIVLDTNNGIYYDCATAAALAKGFTRHQVKSGIRKKGIYHGLLYA